MSTGLPTRPDRAKHVPRHAGSRKRKQEKDPTKNGFFRRFWWVFVLVPIVAFVGLFGTLWYVYSRIEIPNAPPGPQTTFVYDRNGKVITTLHAEVNRTEISLNQMPDSL